MARADACSRMKDDETPWSYSKWTLRCVRCEKDIQLDLLLGAMSRDKMWPDLEKKEYATNVTRRLNKEKKNAGK